VAKLGSFTVAKKRIADAQATEPPELDTFEFEGEQFRVTRDAVPSVPLMELADAYASSGDDAFSMEALAATWQMIKFCVHEDDFPRFRRTAMDARAGLGDLLPIMQLLWEAVSGPPSDGPSDLPDGPSNTTRSSKAASPSRTAPPSSSKAKRSRRAAAPASPDVKHLTPANEWTPPTTIPTTDARLVPVDDLVA
jgi:hypothetical protein